MASLQKVGTHLARTTTAPRHLAKCAAVPTGSCECLESGATRTRRDVSVTVGGTFSPQTCNLCSPSVLPASCPYSPSPLGTYVVACNGGSGSLDPSFGNNSFFVCTAPGSSSYHYWARVAVSYIGFTGPPYDYVDVLVESGYYRYFGFYPVAINPIQRFTDRYEYSTRANCTSLSFISRNWSLTGTVNGCDISGITTSATVL